MGVGTQILADFIPCIAAARILKCDERLIKRLAASRRIAVRVIPGSRILYSRTDIERIARESIIPAKAVQ